MHSTGPPFQLENPRLTFGTSIGLSSQNLRKPQKSLRTFVLVLVFPKFLCRSCSSVCAPFGFGGVCETSSPFIALHQAPFIVLFCPSFHSGTAISPLLSPPFLMRINFHRSCFPQLRTFYVLYFASGRGQDGIMSLAFMELALQWFAGPAGYNLHSLPPSFPRLI